MNDVDVLDRMQAEVDEKRADKFIPAPGLRADCCSAQAWIKAVNGDKELFFCGHHGHNAEAGLIASGWMVTDKTDLLKEDRLKGSEN